jgi:hypothetical protein
MSEGASYTAHAARGSIAFGISGFGDHHRDVVADVADDVLDQERMRGLRHRFAVAADRAHASANDRARPSHMHAVWHREPRLQPEAMILVDPHESWVRPAPSLP